MKKALLSLILLVLAMNVNAQQMPEYTQYPAVLFQINPAYTGTKGTLDARLNYRRQWTGFSGAPVTQFAGLHGNLFKGRLGLGTTVYKDATGPSNMLDYGFSASYHLRFPDVAFCVGIGMRFNRYTMNTSGMTTHWEGDPALIPVGSTFDKTKNAQGGLLLYNDRFHFGLGVMNIITAKALLGSGNYVKFRQHYYFTFGYNFNAHPDFVWENNLMGTYVDGLPMTLHYNLRVHYREKFTFGTAWRLRDAIALQAGMVFLKRIQVIYSYDIGISRLRKAHNGSHEVTLGFRLDYDKKKAGYKNFENFQRQRYNIF